MGQTRVDLLHLLEDLRDAYPGSLEETILTEIIANSLDSGARHISLLTDPPEKRILVVDDGAGMVRRSLARYHDIAASSKIRGQSIGFAGVGIKLGLLVCEEVLTETRREKNHVATRWHLATRHRAPWNWVTPPGWICEHGTGVSLTLKNALSPLLDMGFIESTIRNHFAALVESAFDEILAPRYPEGVRFRINDHWLEKENPPMERCSPIAVRLARKRKPSAVGYVLRTDQEQDDDRRGLAISTMGKVIRRGWDWLGITPPEPERVGGIIEAPGLAECLTLNKADFIRSGVRGMTYLAYRKSIQETLFPLFSEWGNVANEKEVSRRRKTRPLERDLETVLVDLAGSFPLLGTLVERRAGGQRRLPVAGANAGDSATSLVTDAAAHHSPPTPAGAPERRPDESGSTNPESSARPASAPPLPAGGRSRRKRPARYSLNIQFEQRDEGDDVSRLVESTVWVNTVHPAYRRAAASRAEGYHLALAVGMALAPLAAEPGKTHEFVTAFLARWGESDGTKKPARKLRARRAASSGAKQSAQEPKR